MADSGTADKRKNRKPATAEQAMVTTAVSQVALELGTPVPSWGSGDFDDHQRLQYTEQLLDAHQAVVFRYAYRLSGCSSTAEDIAQEVFLRAFRSIHQLRDVAAARGWLLAIARNEFSRLCRKSAAAGVDLDTQVVEIADEEQTPALDRNEWVALALEQLPSEFRVVLLMFYFEELSYAQIAEQLDIPLGTVMSRLNRGKNHMKAALSNNNTA